MEANKPVQKQILNFKLVQKQENGFKNEIKSLVLFKKIEWSAK